MKLLVLSYPRSGTRYIRTALADLGMRIGHETVLEDGVVSWCHIMEPADLVVHQVRYPLDAINSFRKCSAYAKRYVRDVTGISMEGNQFVFLAEAYLAWHDLIENRKPAFRYRVEDLPWPRTDFTDHGRRVPTKDDLTISRLYSMGEDYLAVRLSNLIEEYGYEVIE
jgi:hypothetical protein